MNTDTRPLTDNERLNRVVYSETELARVESERPAGGIPIPTTNGYELAAYRMPNGSKFVTPRMKTYKPERLTLWTRPSCYIGATWEEYFGSGISQTRDSGALDRSNFECMVAALKAIPEPADWPHDCACFQVVRENHWAVGWVEWIAIHQDAADHLHEADRIAAALEDYPVIDEMHYSQEESDEANEVWRNCYRPKERLAYIRKHRSQFEFRGLADLIGCVRGNYFAGYASELLS